MNCINIDDFIQLLVHFGLALCRTKIRKEITKNELDPYLQMSDLGLDLPSKAKWFPKWISRKRPG